jgi:hypothetical protein
VRVRLRIPGHSVTRSSDMRSAIPGHPVTLR